MAAEEITPARRKSILTVLFASLLLDLLSFTLILPLFPKLLDFYRAQPNNVLLESIFTALNTFKASFHRPISDRYDVVLLGGALGSLFSLLQAFASPFIGALSDRYGRRTALLYSMAGNILSVLLWVGATTFPIFLASRVVGGLSEGNVQLAIAIATDVSSAERRGATMALVGAAFSIAFTCGPMLGAYLASKTLSLENPFATAAAFSLGLIVLETVFLYFKLPETRPPRADASKPASNGAAKSNGHAAPAPAHASSATGVTRLSLTHLFFLLIFSGMEFSLPFMTYDLFSYSSAANGRLLGFIGLVAALLQGSVVRRLPASLVAKMGFCSCTMAFFLLGRVQSEKGLYLAAACLAVTSASVVMSLTALASLRVKEEERGRVMGNFRSAGQVGRALGPLLFCTLYWWAGREAAYALGTAGMVAVTAGAWSGLREPAAMPPAPEVKVEKKGQ